MIDFSSTCEESFYGFHKVFPHGTTDTSVRYLYYFLGRFFYEFCIDASRSELILYYSDTTTVRISDYVVQESGLSTSEKSGEYGDGDFFFHEKLCTVATASEIFD